MIPVVKASHNIVTFSNALGNLPHLCYIAMEQRHLYSQSILDGHLYMPELCSSQWPGALLSQELGGVSSTLQRCIGGVLGRRIRCESSQIGDMNGINS